ncbi:HAD family hydrolase [Deferrisoma camini]|uniref:HAD family hydrolase n=1 Tax=Deferrisoma camini TaxID=1035120 RepID=UPI00046D4474|nr:HAD family hydrolase [Deferrisoma camini]
MTRAVVFDLDGTLVDSLADIARAGNAVLRRRGLPEHPEDAYRRFVGDGMEMLVRRIVPAGSSEDEVGRVLADLRAEYARRSLETTRPYPGVPELLDRLVARGIPFSVVTNKPHEPAVEMVGALLGRWRFSAVIGAMPDLPRKPHPAGALRAAAVMGVEPEACLYVGDTATDVATARAAGMVPVGVLWGFRGEAELREAGARHLLRRPEELLALLAPAG